MKTTRYKHEKRDLHRFAKSMDVWARKGAGCAAQGDYEAAATCLRELRDLRAVYDAVWEGDYAKAGEIARWLNSVVRDQIPRRLFKIIGRHWVARLNKETDGKLTDSKTRGHKPRNRKEKRTIAKKGRRQVERRSRFQ